MSDERAIRTIAIAGGGIVALSAALAFARSLTRTRVTLIETALDPAALADIIPTSGPAIAEFHAAVGLDERELLRAKIATHHLGTAFEDWPGAWVHAWGTHGKPVGAIAFDEIWLRARQAGEALDYERYSIAAALGRAGKFVHPSRDASAMSSRFTYALRFDPKLYYEALRRQADLCAVQIRAGRIGEIERTEHGVAALVLDDGSRIEADMFVDCMGPTAPLLSAIDESFEDWDRWMPFTRFELGEEPAAQIPLPLDHVRANDSGWTADWPLRGKVLKMRLLAGGSGGVMLTKRRRLRPWVGNVLALGDAATAADPLHGLSLDLAHNAILLALELLPGRDFPVAETAEYNRRSEQHTRRVRDFLALHYVRSGRKGGAWAKAARGDLPDSLARTLDQYRHRGRLPFHEEERVNRDSWSAALLGLGMVPRNVDPQAAGVPLDKAVPAMRQLAREIDDTVGQLPSYGDYLAALMR